MKHAQHLLLPTPPYRFCFLSQASMQAWTVRSSGLSEGDNSVSAANLFAKRTHSSDVTGQKQRICLQEASRALKIVAFGRFHILLKGNPRDRRCKL